MHSPWGMLYQICKETGWTWHYVLWKVSRPNLMLMMADRPNFKNSKDVVKKVDGKGLGSMLKNKRHGKL
jgi:hypothetical protein